MKTRGFTLLELLLAMALTVLIAGAIGTTVYTAFHAKARAEAVVDSTRAQDAAVAQVTKDIEQALPENAVAQSVSTAVNSTSVATTTTLTLVGADTNGSALVGANNTLTFYATGESSRQAVQGGVRMITYSLATPNGATAPALVRQVTTNLLATNQVQTEPEVVCPNVAALTFKYYDGSTWYDSWDTANYYNALPVAIEVQFELAPAQLGQQGVVVDRVIPVPCGVAQSVVQAESTSASSTGSTQ